MSRNRNNKPLSMVDVVQFHAEPLQRKYGFNEADSVRHASVSLLDTFSNAGAHDHSVGSTILKSLAATGTIPTDGTTGFDATKTTDLVEEIQSTELSADEYAPTWKWITKKPTRQDVVQLTEMSDYGGSDDLGFLDETVSDGGLDSIDPELERKTSPVKWLGQLGKVMRTALVVEALGMSGDPEIGNAMEVAEFARLERLMKASNYGLWHFDNAKNQHEFNGLLRQIEMANTDDKPTEFNMMGQPLTPETLPTVKAFMYHNGARFTDMFAGVRTYTDLETMLIPFAKLGFGDNVPMGINADHAKLLSLFPMNGGKVDFHIDPHLDASPKDGTHVGSSAITAPTSVTGTTSSTSAINKWGSYLAPSGDIFFYAVSAVNSKGESAVTAVTGGGIAVDPGEKVVLTINRSDVATKFYYVYRGTTANNLRLLGRVKCTGAATTFEDLGDKIPGTSDIAFLSNRPIGSKGFTSVMFRQLWPIDKIKLPVAVMSEQFAFLMSGTPQLLRGRQNIRLTNVGQIDLGQTLKPRTSL